MQKGMVNFAFALFAALMLVGSAFAAAIPGGNVPVAGNNIPPVITSVGGPTSITAGQAGTWTVSAHDPDGTYLAYSVNWGEGNNMAAQTPITPGNTATFQHTYSSAGTYTITFTVTDASGATTQATVTTMVSAPVPVNQPPVITNVAGPSSLTAGTSGTWSVSAYDPDGSYLAYSVNWGEGNSVGQQMPAQQQQVGSTATFQHTYYNAGTYTITFTVTDSAGAAKQTTATVAVSEGTAAKCTDTDGGVNIYVKGTTTGATSPGGQVITETDICGSDMVTEYYCKSDGYMSLQVTPCPSGYQCGDGACVKSGSNQPPVITSVGGPTSINANQAGTWTVSAYDPDGTYLAYGVTWGDGLDQKQAGQTKSGSTATFQHTYANAGTYMITFTATDSAGASTQSTLTVNVGGTGIYTFTCTDSDGGANPYVKGTVIVTRISAQNREVWVNSTDYCLGNGRLVEYFCYDDNVAGYTNNTCPSGYACSDGACVKPGASNLPPVITSVGGNSSLAVNQMGRWDITAYDPDGTYLEYSVNFGDNPSVTPTYVGQVAGFQHAYAQAGTYTLTFKVWDSAGATTQSTLSVNVGSGITPTNQKIALNLKKGWNQVSVPTGYSVSLSDIAQKCSVTSAWYYDTALGQYSAATTFGNGTAGAWMKAGSDCTYELDAPYASTWSVPLKAGWNMIGTPVSTVQFSDYAGNCQVTSGPWNYSPSAGQYAQSSMLEPGKGYWVNVAGACTLGANMPPGTPSG